MADESTKHTLLEFLNMLAIMLLIAATIVSIIGWFANYQRAYAISNTSTAIAIALAAYSAKSTRNMHDRVLLIVGMVFTVGFQFWGLMEGASH